jgi:RNA polymerase sigma factor (sigma-70 family)
VLIGLDSDIMRIMNRNLKKHSDLDLISLMFESKQEEEIAFSELYDRYESMLRAYVLTVIRDNTITEDIVQETFITFYNTIKKGNEFPNVPGFLIKVARNLCLNTKRKDNRVSPLGDYDVASDNTSGFENKELLELIIMSTEFLKDKYRRAFMLKEFEGMKYREIAEIESIALATAKIRVMRARKMIISTLKPYIKDISK